MSFVQTTNIKVIMRVMQLLPRITEFSIEHTDKRIYQKQGIIPKITDLQFYFKAYKQKCTQSKA